VEEPGLPDVLVQLVYYSRNRLSGSPEDIGTAIGQILATSRRNNEAANVSGALLFNEGCFGQVLEGPRHAVEATFERIQQDPRHGDVSVLAFDPIENRSFAGWSMAYVGGKSGNLDRFAALFGDSGFDLAHMTGERLHEALVRLITEEDVG
jgi:hypothetical protein